MRFQLLTIFPQLFAEFTATGILSRAISSGLVSLETIHLRDFAVNTQGGIDDTPYGGGSGMVLRPEPADAAIRLAKERDPHARVVLMSPRGRRLDRGVCRELVEESQQSGGGLIVLCCRYEGVDERVVEQLVDHEISIGDYVLMGGETAAMALIESTSRLLPGVLGNPDSIREESFEHNLLEYPQYTKPREFNGAAVPEVLLSGNHAAIDAWRSAAARRDTLERRPDLYRRGGFLEEDLKQRTELLSAALIHYPVVNKEGKLITSSITNLDLHDIARSAKTFGLDRYYLVHPTKTLRRLMKRICEHWEHGYGLTYNPNRSEALEKVEIVSDFEDVLMDIEARTGALPKIISTSARSSPSTVSYEQMQHILARSDEPHLLLFGTGWGLGEELLARADYMLEPICGLGPYNHLSVRAAAAIIFDRLLGRRASP